MNLRLRYGLRWRTHRPPLGGVIKALVILALMSYIVWAWAVEVPAELDALQAAATAERIQAERYRTQFDICLNGGIVGRDGNIVLICDGAHEANYGKVELIK